MIQPNLHPEYYNHAFRVKENEVLEIETLNQQLPDTIIDSHVHASNRESVERELSATVLDHMVSTYLLTTFEHSARIDQLFFPGKEIRKLRFAHAFSGINHRVINHYLINSSSPHDRVALFGLSETPSDIEYSISQLQSGKYSGLKMYYMASEPPKSVLYDYFPIPILAEAEKQQTPIILHPPKGLKGSVTEIEDLAIRFPKLPIVLAHIGVTFKYHEKLNDLLSHIANLPNIWVDTSGVTDEDVIFSAINTLGVRKVLYGSDEPLNLLRDFVYNHPEKGERLLTDYPYHWVDQDDFKRFSHLVPKDLTYNQIQQLRALLRAIRRSPNVDEVTQQIFHDNSQDLFGF